MEKVTYIYTNPFTGKKAIVQIAEDAPQEAINHALENLRKATVTPEAEYNLLKPAIFPKVHKIDYTCLKCKSRQVQNKFYAWCNECISK